jgi:hypothetical protein
MLIVEVLLMAELKGLDDNVISSKKLSVALIETLRTLSGAKFSSEEEADAYAVKAVRVVRASSEKSE